MIPRYAEQQVRQALDRQAAVALLGPRQIGKTTLARSIADDSQAKYLDLDSDALLGISDLETLMGHPVVGMSWEGFVIENILSVAPARTNASFYRTAAGAEIDLVLEIPGHGLWAIEIKRGLVPKTGKGLHHAREDLRPSATFVVYSGHDRYPLADGIDAIGLPELMQTLRRMA